MEIFEVNKKEDRERMLNILIDKQKELECELERVKIFQGLIHGMNEDIRQKEEAENKRN